MPTRLRAGGGNSGELTASSEYKSTLNPNEATSEGENQIRSSHRLSSDGAMKLRDGSNPLDHVQSRSDRETVARQMQNMETRLGNCHKGVPEIERPSETCGTIAEGYRGRL